MGLLHKRPLALFCTCFITVLYAAVYCSSTVKLWCFAIAFAIAIGLLLLSFFHAKRRTACIALMLCFLSVSFALMHAYVGIDRRKEEALEYTGKRTVECQVLALSYVDSWHAEYEAELLQIGEDEVRIRTYLICGFPAELHAGDRVLARVDLIEPDEQAYGVCSATRTRDSRILLSTVLHDVGDGEILQCAEASSVWSLLAEPNGIELVSDRMRIATASLFDRTLGKESSPLARSFFFGDKSDLSPHVVRDFRRTGTSHLLAVSGLHIAVLLGGLEWLLRKLTLPKVARIAAVSLSGLLLLMVTGFSMSACRSVLMLFAVYLNYLLSKESDAITSLLVAVSLILVVSVDAVWDIGLWMSFLATLGLLTVYPLLERSIPRKLSRGRIVAFLWRVARFVITTILMSTVTGVFLLPIQWSVFRELSLMTIPANLAIAPLGIFYLYAIPFVLILSPLPWIGTLACRLLAWIGQAMASILAFFSERDFAMLSLRYRFASVIIPLLALCMLLLLLIRLRRKWLLAVPPTVAVICFTVCLLVTFRTEAPMATDYTNGVQRFLAVTDNGQAVLYDLSCEDSNAYFDGADTLFLQGATDIDALVLGHVSEEHPDMLEAFLPYTVVHRLYLPLSVAEHHQALTKTVVAVAEDSGCEVYLYENDVTFPVISDTLVKLYADETCVIAFSMEIGTYRVSYADPSRMSSEMWQTWYPYLCESQTVWLDSAACDGKGTITISASDSQIRKIFLRTPHDHACLLTEVGEIPVYRYPQDKKKRVISFFLES